MTVMHFVVALRYKYKWLQTKMVSLEKYHAFVAAAAAAEGAFLTGLLRPQATLTSAPPSSTLAAHLNAASSALLRFLKLTKAQRDVGTRVMDLM